MSGPREHTSCQRSFISRLAGISEIGSDGIYFERDYLGYKANSEEFLKLSRLSTTLVRGSGISITSLCETVLIKWLVDSFANED